MGLALYFILAFLAGFLLLCLFVKRKLSQDTNTNFLAQGFPKEMGIPSFPIIGRYQFDSVDGLYEDIRDVIAEAILFYRRLSCLCVVENGKTNWKAVKVNVPDHLKKVEVKGAEEMEKYTNELVTTPLEKDKPLWDCHIVKNLNGESSVFFRFDHAVGDGVSLAQTLLKVVSDADGKPLKMGVFTRPASQQEKADSVGVIIGKILWAAFVTAKTFLKCFLLPMSPADTATNVHNPHTYKYSGKRAVVWAPSVSLESIKPLRAHFNCTVNDVMSACVCGSLRRYLEHTKDPNLTAAMQQRALLPFSMPRTKDAHDPDCLENRWCFISLPLPTGEADMKKRLQRVIEECQLLKTSPEPIFQIALMAISQAALPHAHCAVVGRDVLLKHSLVFTNVPGPGELVLMAGRPVKHLSVFVGNCIPQFNLISYNGNLNLTIVVDTAVVEKPSLLADFFIEELEALKSEVPS